jgi:hypothetical protein
MKHFYNIKYSQLSLNNIKLSTLLLNPFRQSKLRIMMFYDLCCILAYNAAIHNNHVLCFDVSSEVNFSLESSAACLTGERFKSCMFSAMGYKVGWLTETFAALHTFMWLFTLKKRVFTELNNCFSILVLIITNIPCKEINISVNKTGNKNYHISWYVCRFCDCVI